MKKLFVEDVVLKQSRVLFFLPRDAEKLLNVTVICEIPDVLISLEIEKKHYDILAVANLQTCQHTSLKSIAKPLNINVSDKQVFVSVKTHLLNETEPKTIKIICEYD